MDGSGGGGAGAEGGSGFGGSGGGGEEQWEPSSSSGNFGQGPYSAINSISNAELAALLRQYSDATQNQSIMDAMGECRSRRSVGFRKMKMVITQLHARLRPHPHSRNIRLKQRRAKVRYHRAMVSLTTIAPLTTQASSRNQPRVHKHPSLNSSRWVGIA